MYNAAMFISEALESIFAQTYIDYEIIVINDGSPDTKQLEEVLDPFRDRITYLKQENQGAGGARNTGLKVAKDEIIAFLDSDDILLAEFLESQVAFLVRLSGTLMFYFFNWATTSDPTLARGFERFDKLVLPLIFRFRIKFLTSTKSSAEAT